ncbi:MAG: glycosyltransferase [Micrococcus sp.]|nr:glycosyltransferase [Micrococcus sp.]
MVTTELTEQTQGAPGRPGAGRTTVVIATRNRREELLATLHHHEAPVIVVDNASTDGTPDAVEAAFPAVRVIRLRHNRGAVARTMGARAATTDYVAFADDDSWWAPGALAAAERVFDAHPGIGLLAASIAVGPEDRPDPINAVLADSPLGLSPTGVGPRLLGFVACAAVVRRTAFLAVGGFDTVVRFPGEEERLALDLADSGWELVHAPDLWVHHHPSQHREPGETRQRDLVRSALLTALMRRDWADVAGQVRTAWRAGARGTQCPGPVPAAGAGRPGAPAPGERTPGPRAGPPERRDRGVPAAGRCRPVRPGADARSGPRPGVGRDDHLQPLFRGAAGDRPCPGPA